VASFQSPRRNASASRCVRQADARLDLDKGQQTLALRDQVDLASGGADALVQHLPAILGQPGGHLGLGEAATRLGGATQGGRIGGKGNAVGHGAFFRHRGATATG
jgi:hypothetical protein